MYAEPQTAIERAFCEGRAAWPAVALTEATFAEWVAAAAVHDAKLAIHGRDLFLAAACAHGDPAALAVLEREFIVNIPEYVARFHLTPDLMDELRQRVRLRLLAGDYPRIRAYRGQGALGAWLRTCTIRVALNMREIAAATDQHHDTDGWGMLTGIDPALDKLLDGQRHRPTLKAAMDTALASLDARQKTLLRMHFMENLHIDDMALVFHVHRATVARWLVGIRKLVLERFQNELALDLGARPSEAQSLVRLLRSELQVSVCRALGNQ